MFAGGIKTAFRAWPLWESVLLPTIYRAGARSSACVLDESWSRSGAERALPSRRGITDQHSHLYRAWPSAAAGRQTHIGFAPGVGSASEFFPSDVLCDGCCQCQSARLQACNTGAEAAPSPRARAIPNTATRAFWAARPTAQRFSWREEHDSHSDHPTHLRDQSPRHRQSMAACRPRIIRPRSLCSSHAPIRECTKRSSAGLSG